MAILNKSQQVEAYLRRAIKQGNWAPGSKLGAEREMLTTLNVSRSTLREAYSTLASEGLVERRQGAGTFVVRHAKKASVGIIANVEHLASPLGYNYKLLIDGAGKRIDQAGYGHRLLVGNGEDSVLGHNFTKDSMAEMAGVLSTVWVNLLDQEALDREGVGLVSIAGAVPISEYCVVYDYARMIEMAAELLTAHGYDDFVIIHMKEDKAHSGDHSWRFNELISEACDKAVGGDRDRLLTLPSSRDYGRSYEVFKALWLGDRRPRAIFFLDDAICDVATRAMLELGVRVGQDLAIVTQSNVGREFHFPVPLTRLEFDPDETVGAAWDMLSALMRREPLGEKTVYVRPKVRQGDSV